MGFPVEVMSVGTWNGTPFTIDHLKSMADNFVALKGAIKPPVKLGHSKDETGKPALGWVADLKVQGNKLIAFLEDVPDLLMAAIKKKFYRRVSSEVFFNYTLNGKKYDRVFSGLALLGAETPAVKDLEDIQAYLTQNSHGSFERMEIYVSGDTDNNLNNHEGGDEMPIEIEKLAAQVAEMQSKITALFSENTQLKADKETAEKKLVEEQNKAAEQFKESAVTLFSEFCEKAVKDGVMLPAQRDVVCGKERKLVFTEKNEAVITMDQFKKYVELSGKVLERKQYTQGEGAEDGKPKKFKDPQAEVHARAIQYAKDHSGVAYADAVFAVLDEDEKLATAYSDNFQARSLEEGE